VGPCDGEHLESKNWAVHHGVPQKIAVSVTIWGETPGFLWNFCINQGVINPGFTLSCHHKKSWWDVLLGANRTKFQAAVRPHARSFPKTSSGWWCNNSSVFLFNHLEK
jgi:hypothetical protein